MPGLIVNMLSRHDARPEEGRLWIVARSSVVGIPTRFMGSEAGSSLALVVHEASGDHSHPEVRRWVTKNAYCSMRIFSVGRRKLHVATGQSFWQPSMPSTGAQKIITSAHDKSW